MFKALVVDDEPLMVDYLKKNLTKINNEWETTATASDGIYAVHQLQHNKFDVVITDIKMPGMDGLELAKYLSKNHPEIPIVIISGYDEFNYARTAVRLNVFDYLLKPLRDEELSAVLSAISMEKEQRNNLTIDKPVISNANTLTNQILDYLHLHFREGLSLTILADIFSITPSYLSAIFHKEIGEPYSKYLLKLRMETAKAMLTNPNAKVIDIAKNVGFASSKHFGSVFKNYYGISPGEFRDKNQKI